MRRSLPPSRRRWGDPLGSPYLPSGGYQPMSWWLCFDEGKCAVMPKKVTIVSSGPLPNSISVKRPDLLAEWDWDKNAEVGLTPDTATCGMNRTAHWICPDYHHSYTMKIDNRVRSTLGCPFCSGRRVLTGFNDLATTHPEIADEWISAVDKDATPQTVSAGSHVIVRWKCSTHECEWESAVFDRTDGCGCPQCKSAKISAARSKVKDGNSLAEQYPDVARQWDYSLNSKTPYQVSAHAKMMAYWVCDLHDPPYRWEARVYSRTCNRPSGCPKCAIAAIVEAEKTPKDGQSLGDLYPDAIKEWDYKFNGDLTPFNIKPSSQQRVGWKCSICGNTWITSPGNRTAKHTFRLGCRECNCSRLNPNRLTPRTNGYLKDMRPDIAAEWDTEKNMTLLGLSLDDISISSNLNVWWTCPLKHSYQATVNHRTGRGDGCSICAITTHVSFPEKAVYYYVSHAVVDAEENARPPIKGLGNLEFDIWIPSMGVAVEYDGHFWHQDINRDMRKDKICKNAGIKLIRIRECGCPSYESSAVLIDRETVYDSWSLDKAIVQLLEMLDLNDANLDVDTARDDAEIRSLVGWHDESTPI